MSTSEQQQQPNESKVISGKKAEDDMMLPLDEALSGLYDSDGNKITFQPSEPFANDPSNVPPFYYYEDTQNNKSYTLSFEPPHGLVTLRVSAMPQQQQQQNAASPNTTKEIGQYQKEYAQQKEKEEEEEENRRRTVSIRTGKSR
jgi:hypothetical protein